MSLCFWKSLIFITLRLARKCIGPRAGVQNEIQKSKYYILALNKRAYLITIDSKPDTYLKRSNLRKRQLVHDLCITNQLKVEIVKDNTFGVGWMTLYKISCLLSSLV